MFGSKRKREKLIDDVLGKAIWEVNQWMEDFETTQQFGQVPDSAARSTSTSALVAAAYALPLSIMKKEGGPYKQAAPPFLDAVSRLFKGVDAGIELVRQGEPNVKANLSTAEARERLQATYMSQTKKMEAYTKGYMDFLQKGPGCGAGVLLCETVTQDIFGQKTFDLMLAQKFIGLPNRISQCLT